MFYGWCIYDAWMYRVANITIQQSFIMDTFAPCVMNWNGREGIFVESEAERRHWEGKRPNVTCSSPSRLTHAACPLAQRTPLPLGSSSGPQLGIPPTLPMNWHDISRLTNDIIVLYICTYCVYIYIYIYLERERERERNIEVDRASVSDYLLLVQ